VSSIELRPDRDAGVSSLCLPAVVRASDFGDAPVGCYHKNGRHVVLQGAVEEGEALDVQHVHLIDE